MQKIRLKINQIENQISKINPTDSAFGLAFLIPIQSAKKMWEEKKLSQHMYEQIFEDAWQALLSICGEHSALDTIVLFKSICEQRQLEPQNFHYELNSGGLGRWF